MRIALVSPYSWTYPGGVTRHIEALSTHLREAGHDVRVLAPYDPDDALSLRLHRGARPQALPPPDVSLGRTVGFRMNGAVSNIAVSREAVVAARGELRGGGYDVVHLHEPGTPVVCWDALGVCQAPLVGTFHTYSTNVLTNGAAALIGASRRMSRLHVRIAVSEAAAWTARRFFGGRYRVVPNGVELDPLAGAVTGSDGDGEPLRIVFVGQAVQRKGLPVLLRAFEALREHVPAHLTIIGAGPEEVAPLLLDDRDVLVRGKVDDAEKRARLREADVLCAPSLHGESFGMVLTEAFAAGTPAVASDIAGYRDVVRDGVDGVLVGREDPVALAGALRALALDRARLRDLSEGALQRAQRYAWQRVCAEVCDAYEDARAIPAPQGSIARLAARHGLRPADGLPRVPAQRSLPSPEPAGAASGHRTAPRLVRRGALALMSAGVAVLFALALQRIGAPRVAASIVSSQPSLLALALGLSVVAMVARASAWLLLLRGVAQTAGARLADALAGTFVGVLMNATLPARLGEPCRSVIVARRIGRARSSLPAVRATVVGQSLFNVVALAVLGGAMSSGALILGGGHGWLLGIALAPVLAFGALVLGPPLAGAVLGVSSTAPLRDRLLRVWRRLLAGLAVLRSPRRAGSALALQLGAWAIQWLECYLVLAGLGISTRADAAAAAGVLFAVNATAIIPPTPANIGVFQAACVAVLHGVFGVGIPAALAYGILLQALELISAVAMGAGALAVEGLSYREVRLRALHSTIVSLAPLPARKSARTRL